MSMAGELSSTGQCEMVLLVQAEFDGELDAAQAANFQAHRTNCTDCQAAELELTRARTLFRDDLYQPAPGEVRQRILARLDAIGPRPVLGPAEGQVRERVGPPVSSCLRLWGQSAFTFGLGAACAAMLAFLVLAPAERTLTEQVVAGHVRALQPGHLEDIASSDHHTVKPWFDGRIDFSSPVKDLGTAGFPLKGGRLDYIGGRPVAALVYQRGMHIIDLFVWPTRGNVMPALEPIEHNGYNVMHWSQNRMEFWAVSDVERSELRDFAQDWRRSP
jgi:anti-sigma factor RsiW